MTMPDQVKIAELYNAGMKTQLIAETMNVSTAQVSYYAHKHGCKMRKGWKGE